MNDDQMARNALFLRKALTLYVYTGGIVTAGIHEDMRKSASLITGERYSTYESAEKGLTAWLEDHCRITERYPSMP